MIFGSQFYPLLDKMTNWRQSIFALVLATRQYPNFELWTELEKCQGANEYKQVLQLCWEYHFDKFNHIDLTEAFEIIAPYIPESAEEDGDLPNEGARFAFDAAISLNAAIEAIVIDTNEAANASKASMAAVIRLCEHKYAEEDLDEDALLEKPEILEEIDFQVGLMELVQQPRTPELILSILKYVLKEDSSNIGFELNFKLEDFYRPEEWGKHGTQAKNDSTKTKQAPKVKARTEEDKTSAKSKVQDVNEARPRVVFSQSEQDLLEDLKDAGFDLDDLQASGFALITEANELLAEEDQKQLKDNSAKKAINRKSHGVLEEKRPLHKGKGSHGAHSARFDKKRSDRPFKHSKDKHGRSAQADKGGPAGHSHYGDKPHRGRTQREEAKRQPRIWNNSAQ